MNSSYAAVVMPSSKSADISTNKPDSSYSDSSSNKNGFGDMLKAETASSGVVEGSKKTASPDASDAKGEESKSPIDAKSDDGKTAAEKSASEKTATEKPSTEKQSDAATQALLALQSAPLVQSSSMVTEAFAAFTDDAVSQTDIDSADTAKNESTPTSMTATGLSAEWVSVLMTTPTNAAVAPEPTMTDATTTTDVLRGDNVSKATLLAQQLMASPASAGVKTESGSIKLSAHELAEQVTTEDSVVTPMMALLGARGLASNGLNATTANPSANNAGLAAVNLNASAGPITNVMGASADNVSMNPALLSPLAGALQNALSMQTSADKNPSSLVFAAAQPSADALAALTLDAKAAQGGELTPMFTMPLTSTTNGTSPIASSTFMMTVSNDSILGRDTQMIDGLAARMSWAANQQMTKADISISSPDLGPVDIHIDIDGASLKIEFSSAQIETRHVLEAGLPRLREMLSGQGLQLTQADVGGGQQQGTRDGREPPTAQPEYMTTTESRQRGEADVLVQPMPRQRGNGLLDAYV